MSLDCRLMELSDWVWLSIVALMCLAVGLGLCLKPVLPWNSFRRWKDPARKDRDIGEPGRRFLMGCRICGLVLLLLGVLIVLAPFLPLLK